MRIYISAGEVSGQQHAARLCRALREHNSGLEFTGMGGDLLAEAGVEIKVDLGGRAVMGLIEVLKHLPFLKKRFDQSLAHILSEKPDAVILVDYPGFHLRLAQAVKRANPSQKILYYIAPKAWAWNEGRVKKIAQSVDRLFCIFPFEEDWFRSRGVDAKFVGNPTNDAVMETPPAPECRWKLSLPENGKIVSLFPGSRQKELERIFPPMLKAAEIMRDEKPDLSFAVAVAPGFSRQSLHAVAPIPDDFSVIEGRGLELMASSGFVFAKSGTTTLEAALLGIPLAVPYRANPVSAFLALKILLKIPHVSLPNIIAGKEIVPELLQENCTPEKLAATALPLLEDTECRRKMLADLLELKKLFGTELSAPRAAAAMLAAIG
jgi:lipid-A-disaccharide synthase